MYENVAYIPLENTLNTKVKQIRNPQKEISGGFYLRFNSEKLNQNSCLIAFWLFELLHFLLIDFHLK